MTVTHHESKQFTARFEGRAYSWLCQRAAKNKHSINQELNLVLGILMRFEESQKQKAAVRAAAPMTNP